MVTGEMPYQTVASPDDPFYSQLVSGDSEAFWRRFQVALPAEENLQNGRSEVLELLFCLLVGTFLNVLKHAWSFVIFVGCLLF